MISAPNLTVRIASPKGMSAELLDSALLCTAFAMGGGASLSTSPCCKTFLGTLLEPRSATSSISSASSTWFEGIKGLLLALLPSEKRSDSCETTERRALRLQLSLPPVKLPPSSSSSLVSCLARRSLPNLPPTIIAFIAARSRRLWLLLVLNFIGPGCRMQYASGARSSEHVDSSAHSARHPYDTRSGAKARGRLRPASE
mmetsp:Transcript_13384/g.26939  ORF Transcript_13384/g.26939 Transcript_13384/m.26939 type:complete len:200 (+) Transcript_13384:1009-1608(+)